MMKRYRYHIGSYEGDQLDAMVQAILKDVDAELNGRVALSELAAALVAALTPTAAQEEEKQANGRDVRLVSGVGKGFLRIGILMICPGGNGVSMQEWDALKDVPSPWLCSCSGQHDFSGADAEIQFKRVPR
jgi:hypothetical protein